MCLEAQKLLTGLAECEHVAVGIFGKEALVNTPSLGLCSPLAARRSPARCRARGTHMADDEDGATQSTASAEELAGMQKMVKEMATQFLAAALTRCLQAIERAFELQEFVDDNCSAFVDFRIGGEHLLEWTTIHSEYCKLAEGVISSTLVELSVDAQQIFEYAAATGGDPRADKLLSRLLALSDYDLFCLMMHQASQQGPCAA